jgi:hypothetical protein
MLRTIAFVLAAAGSLALTGPARAGLVTSFDLQSAGVNGSTASFNVLLDFPGAPGDQIQALQLGVAGSDPLLTANGTDFSRFSFTPDASTLAGWLELVPLGGGGLGLYAPADPVNGPFLDPSANSILLGTLSVDLTGLPGGANVFVSLAGGVPGLGTDAGGVIGGNLVPSFAADGSVVSVEFADPNGVVFTVPTGNAAVPAPAGLPLALVGAASLLGYRRGRP